MDDVASGDGQKGRMTPERGTIMSVNGVTSTQASAYTYSATESKVNEETKAAEVTGEKKDDSGVVYEPSTKTGTTDSTKKTYTPDTNLINKLKADAEARTAQLRSLVEKMMSGQANTYGKANDIWQFLRSGNYTVDAATKLILQKMAIGA